MQGLGVGVETFLREPFAQQHDLVFEFVVNAFRTLKLRQRSVAKNGCVSPCGGSRTRLDEAYGASRRQERLFCARHGNLYAVSVRR